MAKKEEVKKPAPKKEPKKGAGPVSVVRKDML